jgi:hypothetical protein
MVEDCKYVAWIICGECGEGLVRGVHLRKPMSLFADVPRFCGSTKLRGSSWPGNIISSHLSALLKLELLPVTNSIWMSREVWRNVDGGLPTVYVQGYLLAAIMILDYDYKMHTYLRYA